jgi:hypothetical protein
LGDAFKSPSGHPGSKEILILPFVAFFAINTTINQL